MAVAKERFERTIAERQLESIEREKARGHALHHIPKVHEYNRLVRPF